MVKHSSLNQEEKKGSRRSDRTNKKTINRTALNPHEIQTDSQTTRDQLGGEENGRTLDHEKKTENRKSKPSPCFLTLFEEESATPSRWLRT
jgi:hypothetical protein